MQSGFLIKYLPILLIYIVSAEACGQIDYASFQTATYTQPFFDTTGIFLRGIRKLNADTVVPGTDLLVEVEIFEANKIVALELVENIPNGYKAIPVNNAGATVKVLPQKIIYAWKDQPNGKISYKLKINSSKEGKQIISGTLTTSKFTEISQNWSITSIPRASTKQILQHQYNIPASDFFVIKGIRLSPIAGSRMD